ncbi:MAG: threonine/serine exporter family protein [Methanomicrobiales archaeon]
MDVASLQNTGIKKTEPVGAGSDHLGEVLKAELELGRLLFLAGAPGQRILDSVTFLNEKLQGGRLHVFLGFEAMVITLEHGAEHRVSMCDYPLPVAMNANAIVEISRYLHSLPDGKDPSAVLYELGSLKLRHHVNTVLTFAAITLFTVIFGYFNHADAWALLIITIAVLFACVVRELVIGQGHGYYIGVLATTLVATLAAALLSQVIPTTTPLISLIIPCVFVIPGFQLINGGWEALRNHLHIGIPRLMVFLNVLAIMTVGLLAILLTFPPGADGPGLTFPVPLALVTGTILGGITALCICVIMNAPRQALLLCFLCGATGRFVRSEVVVNGGDVYLGVFCATLVISIIALLFSAHWQLPVALPLVAASVQFIPGYYIILTLQGMARIISMGQSVPYGVVALTISNGLLSLFIAAAIVMGTLLPLLIFGRDRRWY